MPQAQTPATREPAAALLERLKAQRRLLLATDAAAADALEQGTRELAAALAAFGDAARSAGPVDPALGASLRRELAANQALLAGLAAGNRRALSALFGEPTLYEPASAR